MIKVKRINKPILILLSTVLLLGVSAIGLAFASGAPEADFKPGTFTLRIVDGERFTKEQLEDPASIFPGVEILQAREIAYYSDTGSQVLSITLAADSFKSMHAAKTNLEQNPLVKYVSINSLVQRPNPEPFIPTEKSTIDIDGVELIMELEKAQISVDEEIFRVRLTAINTTDNTVTISSPHGGGVYFKLIMPNNGSSSERLVDVERYAMGFPAVVLKKAIAPGSEFSQTFTCALWGGLLETAPPGIYTIQAAFCHMDSPVVEGKIEIKQPEVLSAQRYIAYQPSPVPANVALYEDSTGDLVANATTAADGAYMLDLPDTQQYGASNVVRYTLVVTKLGYLTYTVKNLSLEDLQETEIIDIQRLAGDVNGDGVINALDLTCLLSEFNRAPLLYPGADIDGNGTVNAADLTYLLAGFNKRDIVIENN
jgi:hypothetical protein